MLKNRRDSLRINIGRGLVENEQAIVPQDGPGQTYKLPLADAEVVAAVEDIMVQCDIVQFDLPQHLPQPHVVVLIERVQIVAQTLGEEYRFLRYDGDLTAQITQIHCACVTTVNFDLALQTFVEQAKERRDQGGLAGASSSHNPNFPARLDEHIQILWSAMA